VGDAGLVAGGCTLAAVRTLLARGLAALASLVALLGVSGCGAAGSATRPDSRAGPPRGSGTLLAFSLTNVATVDPGRAYNELDYPVIYATQRPLYSARPGPAQKLVPDLASGPPVISSRGREVTVHIRRGVRFSPPVNRVVTSDDVAYAIERGANPHVANPYFFPYFTLISGATRAHGGAISGISTPNRYTIIFHLVRPESRFFSQALALPLTAPVPAAYARPFDARDPSQYEDHEVATGPYMVQNDAAGRTRGIGWRPGRSVVLVRNANWDRRTDYRPAHLNRIVVRMGGSPSQIGRGVLAGRDMVLMDTPPPAVLALAMRRYRSQLAFSPGAGVNWVALNLISPFTSLDVRRALWAALDRDGMVAGVGKGLGMPGTQFLYPGLPGFAQAGGLAGPNFDFNRDTAGDATLAAHYMKLAGFPAGRYAGHLTVSIIGFSVAPQPARLVADAVQELGFGTRLELGLNPDAVCDRPTLAPEACPTIGAIKDFNDPETVIAPFFDRYPDPQIEAAIARAELVNSPSARARAWAGVDRLLVSNAVAIPWIFRTGATIRSKNVVAATDQWNGGEWDFNFTSLR
jgi:peptide/nickel transport system substrate-binding protein